MSINTDNDNMVGLQGNLVVVMRGKPKYTKEDAYRFAANLVVMADCCDGESPKFQEILDAVMNT